MLAQAPFLVRLSFVAAVAVALGSPAWAQDKDRKPSFSVKASPPVSFSPARIVLVAELKGGADDYQDYYCLDVEWDWGDETRSESSADCEPYVAGESRIVRRFTQERTYHQGGTYKIVLKLKRKDKVVVASNVTVRVRPGAGDFNRYSDDPDD